MKLLVNVDVPDLDRAVAFYRDGLGLRLARRLFDGSVAEMRGAAAPIYLIARAPGSRPFGRSRAGVARDYRRHWTPVHLDFAVADLAAAVARAVEAGATLEQPVARYAWGRLALLADPFGHGFCLVEFSERGYAAVAVSPAPRRARPRRDVALTARSAPRSRAR
ncbi:MAG TPA: VOC family protein [Candidatus Binatia bacterium]|nr:VOC family protein [Candidatus Binatia bacterium]